MARLASLMHTRPLLFTYALTRKKQQSPVPLGMGDCYVRMAQTLRLVSLW